MYQQLEVRRAISHCFMAIDIERFSALSDFTARMRAMAERAREMPALDAGKPVMVAGDPEKHTFARRSRDGIPVDDAKFEEFLALSPEFSQALIA